MTRALTPSLVGVAGLTLAVVAGTAAAADAGGARAASVRPLVFVQTDNAAGNQVVTFRRDPGGRLSRLASVGTGGDGGRLTGSVTDPLASQGSLYYDRARHILLGVNAGSDSIYAFGVRKGRLFGPQVLGSGGRFPVSVTVHGNLLYVLNAKGQADIQGFRIRDGRVARLPGSHRSLRLTPVTGPNQFVSTPGQISFTPDGRQLIVTTKNNGSHIDVFPVRRDGRPARTFVANASTTPVPFAISFGRHGWLVVGEAGTSNLSTYIVHRDGRITPVSTRTDGQKALCWVTPTRGYFFVSNTGSGTVTGFRIDRAGVPAVVSQAQSDAGPIDSTASGQRFLYVEAGIAGAVDEYLVHRNGTLSRIGSVTGLAGLEGIAATG